MYSARKKTCRSSDQEAYLWMSDVQHFSHEKSTMQLLLQVHHVQTFPSQAMHTVDKNDTQYIMMWIHVIWWKNLAVTQAWMNECATWLKALQQHLLCHELYFLFFNQVWFPGPERVSYNQNRTTPHMQNLLQRIQSMNHNEHKLKKTVRQAQAAVWALQLGRYSSKQHEKAQPHWLGSLRLKTTTKL